MDGMLIVTGLLTLFNGVLAVLTYLIWSTGKTDTRILQRAYIAVEPGGIHALLTSGDIIGHIAMKNSGHLPARNVSWIIDIKESTSRSRCLGRLLQDEPRGGGNSAATPGLHANCRRKRAGNPPASRQRRPARAAT